MTYYCKHAHRVFEVTATDTNLVLFVSNSTNIGNGERFTFYFPKCKRGAIGAVITGAPLPTLININGVNVQLIDSNNQAVDSNEIPRRSDGVYIVPTTGEPFVKLFYQQCKKCNGGVL